MTRGFTGSAWSTYMRKSSSTDTTPLTVVAAPPPVLSDAALKVLYRIVARLAAEPDTRTSGRDAA